MMDDGAAMMDAHGLSIGMETQYWGKNQVYPSGNKLPHGATGTVTGKCTHGQGMHLTVMVQFPGNSTPVGCHPEKLQHTPGLPIPGYPHIKVGCGVAIQNLGGRATKFNFRDGFNNGNSLIKGAVGRVVAWDSYGLPVVMFAHNQEAVCIPNIFTVEVVQTFNQSCIIKTPEEKRALQLEGMDPHVKELFAAMDVNGDDSVTKVEFLEFIREHKPRDAPWNSVAKLLTNFELDHHTSINRWAFAQAFEKAKSKGLDPEAFEYKFAN
jgi:hypothetical protein